MELTTTTSNENIHTWLSRKYITNQLRLQLSDSAILFVPFEDLRDDTSPVFPVMTQELFHYFNDRIGEFAIGVCIEDQDYMEFVFNTDYKRIGKFIVLVIAIPLFIAVMNEYITENFIKKDDTKPIVVIAPTTTIDNSQNTFIQNNQEHRVIPDKKYMEPTHIKFTVTVVDSMNRSKEIHYEGPAKDVGTAFAELKKYEESTPKKEIDQPDEKNENDSELNPTAE